MRTRVYVDGFNLYHGALRGRPGTKWLDLDALCHKLLGVAHSIEHIHYCTAHITARSHDPSQPQRQQIYFRALRTIPRLTITLGNFLTNDVTMPRVSPAGAVVGYVKVRKTEEKGSDVNLATWMLKDGYQNLYDVAVVVSNDSDLVFPIRVVRDELQKQVIVLSPYKRHSRELSRCATSYKPIRAGVLGACQFPPTLTDQHGVFTKPPTW